MITTRGLGALALVACALLAGRAESDASPADAAAVRQACPAYSVAAVIQGKRACLKVGQRCKRRLDERYHRYGFHCNSARLTRALEFELRVSVGGHRLWIACVGRGSPTVILESGGGVPAVLAWTDLQHRVAATTRVCAYDRAGLGGSDLRRTRGPMQAVVVVEELRRLLSGAGLPPPYVLGGWSLGGFFNRLYAKRYPAEVVGLVAVDGLPIGLPEGSWLRIPGYPAVDLIGGPDLPDSYYLAAADAELAAAADLGARPFVLLTRGRVPDGTPADIAAYWVTLQKEAARLSTSSILVRADNAGHDIQRAAPRLTTEAFRLALTAVRARAPLPACAATSLPRLGGTCLDPSSP